MDRALRRFYAKRWKNRVKRRVLRWRWLNEGDGRGRAKKKLIKKE